MFHFDYLIYLRHKTSKPANKVFQSVRHVLTAIWIILTKEHDFAVWMLVAPILWKSRQAAQPVWPFQNIFSTWFIDSPLPRADGGRQSHFCTQKGILTAAAAARPMVSLVIWIISFKHIVLFQAQSFPQKERKKDTPHISKFSINYSIPFVDIFKNMAD